MDMKYWQAIIQAASQSYLAYAALVTLVIAFILYILSKKSGLNGSGLAAYLLTLVFFGLAGWVLRDSSAAINSLYYAGGDGYQFNVGRFLKVTDTIWNDSSLAAISTSGSEVKPSEYSFDYKLKETRGDILFLEATDRENVVIEIDVRQRQIYCSPCNGNRYFLYRIIAP